MKNIFILLLLLFTSSAVLAQESFSSVEERMTGREFKDAGLGKLSDAELEALNKWLRDHSVATLENTVVNRRPGSGTVSTAVAADPSADRRGLEGKQASKDTIVSRLVGEFTGWDSDTVFQLENGMIWKQSEKTDKYFVDSTTGPVVTIKAGMFNSWRLSVEGYNKSVQVDRIQ
jgi:hypothetical protein